MTNPIRFCVLASLFTSSVATANIASVDRTAPDLTATVLTQTSTGQWQPAPGAGDKRVPGDFGSLLENPGGVLIWINDTFGPDDCDPGFYVIPQPPPDVPGLGAWDGDPFFNQVPRPAEPIPGLGAWNGDPFFTQVPRSCRGHWGHFEMVNPTDGPWIVPMPNPEAPTVVVFAPTGTDIVALMNQLDVTAARDAL